MKYSDLIIYSHAIFDAVGDRPFPGAVAVKGKTIQYVGTREGAQTLIGPDTVIRDFGNGLVTPGFCDSHIHFNGAAARCGTLKLRIPQETASEEECVRLLRAFADEHPGRPYYSGGGWNFLFWGDGAGLPTFRSLDRAFPDIPVTFMSADSHTCWMNSAAMEVCNIEEMAKDFPPEWCVRDENGRPTGIAKEEFSLAVPSRIARELHSETIDSETEKSQLKFIEEMNSVGITSVDDVSFAEVDEMDTLYGYLRKFDESDTLSLRVNIYMGTRRDKNRIAAVLPEVRRWQSDRLRVAGLKEALDGVPNTWTAALLAPYSDRPDTCGELKSTGDEYKAWMTEANRLGLITRTHCVGDAAVRTALDACEASMKANGRKYRNAIEHIDIIDPSDIPRFAETGTVASMQPSHVALFLADNKKGMGDRLRCNGLFKTILASGAHIASGTDNVVTRFDPVLTLYYSVTNCDLSGNQVGSPAECMSLAEALKCYTYEGAYLNRMEDRLGTLEVGKYADIAVMDENPFDDLPENVRERKNVCTIFEGKIVYERSSGQ